MYVIKRLQEGAGLRPKSSEERTKSSEEEPESSEEEVGNILSNAYAAGWRAK